MNQKILMSLIQETLIFSLIIGGPFLMTALIVGLLISLIQAATQVQEATLTFFPKWLVLILVCLLLGPWMMRRTRDYITRLYRNVPIILARDHP